jgi:hypothetical protein
MYHLSWHNTDSGSETYVTTDGQSASLSCNKAPIWGLRPDFITMRQLRVCWCGALSLTRRRVCRLQLLLVLASAVILGSDSRGTRDHILLSQIRDSPNLQGKAPVFISPGREWSGYTHRHWVPFSSPPTTRRATVEVFDPASTRDRLRLRLRLSYRFCILPTNGINELVFRMEAQRVT